MKRVRFDKWSAQVGAGTATASASRSRSISASCPRRPARPACTAHDQLAAPPSRRYLSTDAFVQQLQPDNHPPISPPPSAERPSSPPTTTDEPFEWPSLNPTGRKDRPPSPNHSRALKSAKLAALHARLALSDKLPLQTLARSLVDPSADQAPLINNDNLAFLGQTLIAYYTSELLMCKYPRLPMEIMHAAMKAFAGDKTLFLVSRSWGVENAAAPGFEVDPGLLQFDLSKPRAHNTKWGFAAPAGQKQHKFRRGISNRVILSDDFGDDPRANRSTDELRADQQRKLEQVGLTWEKQLSLQDHDAKLSASHNIHAQLVRAVVGAVYTHSGRDAARSFIQAHILARRIDLARLFTFKLPTRELARLCAREEFDPPVARLLSETGRLSRTPVFVVGIFSGHDKLGEGTGSSLDFARQKASMNALKAWYLYSPGENVRVPSEMMAPGARTWEPVYVDIGEVITPGVH